MQVREQLVHILRRDVKASTTLQRHLSHQAITSDHGDQHAFFVGDRIGFRSLRLVFDMAALAAHGGTSRLATLHRFGHSFVPAVSAVTSGGTRIATNEQPQEQDMSPKRFRVSGNRRGLEELVEDIYGVRVVLR